MKILWIVNTIFPAPSKALGLPTPVFGGWMYGLLESLGKNPDIKLAVATTYNGKGLKKVSIEGIAYYLLPCKNNLKYDNTLETIWSIVCEEFSPDLVHIHGTEYPHGLACMRILPNLKYVISIQGLVSVIENYYCAGISNLEILRNITFRDLVKRDTIFLARRKFHKRGLLEKEYIERTKHVIGRTSWDYAHTKAIKSEVLYHFCNESLREGFYTALKWSYDKCEPYTIFLSQSTYPIKGLHQVIKAVAILKTEYPGLKIRLGGDNITKRESINDKIKLSGYGKFICKLLKKHKLEKDIVFLGRLSEEQMIAEYQRSHIFICPSSIENSPNSLGEAQLLGVPTIASYVGGIPDMIEDKKSGLLYRFEEVEMLAEKINLIFEDTNLLNKLSISATQVASDRHDSEKNYINLVNIYKKL